MDQKKGITWPQVACVLVALLLLVLLLLPSLAKAKEGSHRVCAANLKAIGSMIAVYASQSDGRLPSSPASSKEQWVSDEPPELIPLLTTTASPPPNVMRLFYCPQNDDQDPKVLANWNGISVWGYAFFNDRGPDAKGMPQNFPPRVPPIGYVNILKAAVAPSDQILGLDWIISRAPEALSVGSGDVSRPGPPTIEYSTSHMRGKLPAGANVLCADSHTEFRRFDPANAAAIKQPGSVFAYFWIPNP